MGKATSMKRSAPRVRGAKPKRGGRHRGPTLSAELDPDRRAAGAQLSNQPSFQAARVVRAYQPEILNGEGENFTPAIDQIQDELTKQSDLVIGGDLSRLEGMLMSQAHALQSLFTYFAERSRSTANPHHLELFMSFALKAQAQCRATLGTLVEVKYPRQLQFVRQQNVAVNQQVNGSAPAVPASRARAIESKGANELLEVLPDERLEPSAASAAGDSDSTLAALAPVNRPQDA